MVLRLYVHIDETQSLFLAFDLYIISLILSEKQLEIQDSPACIAHCHCTHPLEGRVYVQTLQVAPPSDSTCF